MVVALALLLVRDARLLQQIVLDDAAIDGTLRREAHLVVNKTVGTFCTNEGRVSLVIGGIKKRSDLSKLSKARRVVVAQRAGVAKCLQHNVGFHDLMKVR